MTAFQGGLKGVVWVDVAQMLLLLVIGIAVAITGFVTVGGIDHAFDVAVGGGRIAVPK